MTTLLDAPATDVARTLIDARLDTIDRMLLGRVSRTERLEIVREVECQIHDLLNDRDPDSLTREDVLDVLARLDPPEAYLPDESEVSAEPSPSRRRPIASRPKSAGGTAGKVGGIVGICALVGTLLAVPMFFLASASGSVPFFLLLMEGYLLVGLGLGILALVLSIRGRRQGGLAIAGIVTGAIAAPIYCLMAITSVLLVL